MVRDREFPRDVSVAHPTRDDRRGFYPRLSQQALSRPRARRGMGAVSSKTARPSRGCRRPRRRSTGCGCRSASRCGSCSKDRDPKFPFRMGNTAVVTIQGYRDQDQREHERPADHVRTRHQPASSHRSIQLRSSAWMVRSACSVALAGACAQLTKTPHRPSPRHGRHDRRRPGHELSRQQPARHLHRMAAGGRGTDDVSAQGGCVSDRGSVRACRHRW